MARFFQPGSRARCRAVAALGLVSLVLLASCGRTNRKKDPAGADGVALSLRLLPPVEAPAVRCLDGGDSLPAGSPLVTVVIKFRPEGRRHHHDVYFCGQRAWEREVQEELVRLRLTEITDAAFEAKPWAVMQVDRRIAYRTFARAAAVLVEAGVRKVSVKAAGPDGAPGRVDLFGYWRDGGPVPGRAVTLRLEDGAESAGEAKRASGGDPILVAELEEGVVLRASDVPTLLARAGRRWREGLTPGEAVEVRLAFETGRHADERVSFGAVLKVLCDLRAAGYPAVRLPLPLPPSPARGQPDWYYPLVVPRKGVAAGLPGG